MHPGMMGGMGMNPMMGGMGMKHPVPEITVTQTKKKKKRRRRRLIEKINDGNKLISIQKCTEILIENYMEVCISLSHNDNLIKLDINKMISINNKIQIDNVNHPKYVQTYKWNVSNDKEAQLIINNNNIKLRVTNIKQND